jgi:hypothetical protein
MFPVLVLVTPYYNLPLTNLRGVSRISGRVLGNLVAFDLAKVFHEALSGLSPIYGPMQNGVNGYQGLWTEIYNFPSKFYLLLHLL